MFAIKIFSLEQDMEGGYWLFWYCMGFFLHGIWVMIILIMASFVGGGFYLLVFFFMLMNIEICLL